MINSVVVHGFCATDVLIDQKGKASVLLGYDESYKDKDGKLIERISYLWVNAYGELGRNLNEFKSKGDLITVQGKLTGGSYLDKDGNFQNGLRIKASKIQYHFRQSKSDNNHKAQDNSNQEMEALKQVVSSNTDKDEIPA